MSKTISGRMHKPFFPHSPKAELVLAKQIESIYNIIVYIQR